MAKNQKQNTLERFLKAKEMYEAGKYTSIEDAAKAAKISPATYYNYAKKVTGTEDVSSIVAPTIEAGTELSRTLGEMKTLQQRIDELKEKVINILMVRG